MSYKEIILSNIIGLNPTGTLDFNGTYTMNGNNNIVKSSLDTSKKNLDRSQKNKIICNQVEKFENYNTKYDLNYNTKYDLNYIKNIILIILIIIIFFILFFI
jgi:hypothetical protein